MLAHTASQEGRRRVEDGQNEMAKSNLDILLIARFCVV